MVTKDDERKALEKIRKIVDELGEDSYIAIAFDGCFEIAKENIDNDWACSMKDKAEITEKTCEHAFEALNKREEELKKERHINEELTKKIEELNERITNLKLIQTQYRQEIDGQDRQILNLNEEITKRDAVISNYKDEVVQLKAKLYDMICEQQ